MSTTLRTQVAQLAHELGFEVCRFTKASPPMHAENFQDWLAEGAAGEMAYMPRSKAKRCDPQLVLAGAKSVIVLALNYFQGGQNRPPEGAGAGRIARYAWGEDYHAIAERKLAVIDELLRREGGKQKCYVDTGPVLERDHAAAAGLGWQGKSTMLLNRALGTWFFIAEILTTLEFQPDSAEGGYCGKCTRCIDACPTGAITAPYRLDARRCISYLTIELKTAIPLELRPLIGDRIYGCDDCLDACPWNRFAKVSREGTFQMSPAVASMKLRDYLDLGEEEFRALFRNSPIKRTKRRGLLRNVCVALGNVGTPEDLPALQRAAADPEQLIAEHASWAIEQIERRTSITF